MSIEFHFCEHVDFFHVGQKGLEIQNSEKSILLKLALWDVSIRLITSTGETKIQVRKG